METDMMSRQSASVDSPATAIRDDLARANDDELRSVIRVATDLLAERDAERKREATAKIKALAKEHGLNVAIDRPARKRGRPKKKG